jgi:hypothetical protein
MYRMELLLSERAIRRNRPDPPFFCREVLESHWRRRYCSHVAVRRPWRLTGAKDERAFARPVISPVESRNEEYLRARNQGLGADPSVKAAFEAHTPDGEVLYQKLMEKVRGACNRHAGGTVRHRYLPKTA